MFRIDSSASLADLLAIQKKLQLVQQRQLTLVRMTAQFGANQVRDRIQLTGRNTQGDPMISKSPKRLGRYSASHGKVRQEEGLRTDLINLTFSGELLNGDSWTAIQDSDDSYGAGFSENTMSERADFLEEEFGEVFQLSADEEDAAADYFNNALNDLMTVTF